MSWLLLQGWLSIFNVLGTTETYKSCRAVVLTALCVVIAVYAATAKTTCDALTVVDICLYIVTRTLVSSATRVKKLSKRFSVRNIVNEVNRPTARGTESFDSFVASNSELINAFVETIDASVAPYAYTPVLTPSLRARSKVAYKEYQLFSRLRCKISTRLNKWTCDVSPPIYLHRLTTGTLAAAASFSSAL